MKKRGYCIRYAIANNKGGVGKTTTTSNLSVLLARFLMNGGSNPAGYVLGIDLDSQGNLADALGLRSEVYDPDTNPKGKCLSQLLLGERTLKEVLVSAHLPDRGLPRPNLYIIPASRALPTALAELRIKEVAAQLLRQPGESVDDILINRLEEAGSLFRYILIDCPPALDTLKIAVYKFVHGVIVPAIPDILSGRGTQQHTADLIRLLRDGDVKARLRSLLPTMVDGRLNINQFMLERLVGVYGEGIVADHIPRNVRVSEAPGAPGGGGKTVVEYAPDSTGAQAYEAFANKIWEQDARYWRLAAAGKISPDGDVKPWWTGRKGKETNGDE